VSTRIDRRNFMWGAAAAAVGLASGRVRASSPMTVAAAGDCIITRSVRHIDDPDFLALARLFQQSDVGFGNCEMTFHESAGEPSPTGACGDLNLMADPRLTGDLAWAGFNLMTVANNHGGDYGTAGLLGTLKHLNAAGITAAGGGADLAAARAPRFRSTPHGRVALIGCASTVRAGTEASPGHPQIPGRPGVNPLRVRTIYGLPRDRLAALRDTEALLDRAAGRSAPPAAVSESHLFGAIFREAPEPAVTIDANPDDVKAIVAAVDRARGQADVVIVTIHAHEAGSSRETPAAFFQPFARACIDAGAHACLGHGPHVLRGLEIYRGCPIFYSLGNFYFQAETIRQIPQEIYANCGIASLSPSDFFKKVMGRMFEADPFWEAVAPLLTFENGRLVAAALYPVDLRRHLPPTQRGTPAIARGATADRILQGLADLSRPFGTAIAIDRGVGTVRL